MEVQSYYDQKRQRESVLNEQKKAAQAKAEADRLAKFNKTIEPVLNYKNKLGIVDTDKIINERLADTLKKAEKMFLDQKSDVEVQMFVNEQTRGLDTYQSAYQDIDKGIDQFVSGLGNNSGLDVNQVKELMRRKLMFKEDGKPLSPADMSNVDYAKAFQSILYENPDLLSVSNREKLYEQDGKGYINTEEMNVYNPNDKTKGRGTYSVRYDSRYQNVVKGDKGQVEVVTKSAPITLQNGQNAIDPLTGQEAKGLPQSAYLNAISVPGIAVEINKRTQEKINQLKASRSTKETDFNVFYAMNKGAMSQMNDAQRLNFYRQMSPTKEPEIDEQEVEVLRQVAAREVIDENVMKSPVSINRPAKQSGGSETAAAAEKRQKEGQFKSWLEGATTAFDSGDASQIDTVFRSLLRGGVYEDIQVDRVAGGKWKVTLKKPISSTIDESGQEKTKSETIQRFIDPNKNLQDQIIGIYQNMMGLNEAVERTQTDPRGAKGELGRRMQENLDEEAKKSKESKKSSVFKDMGKPEFWGGVGKSVKSFFTPGK